MSGCPQEADRWSRHGSRAVTRPGSFVAHPLFLFLFSVTNIFWNPDLRHIYLSLSHRCFVSIHFWVICKASDKSELTPISQWDSLHASLHLNCVSFYIFWIQTLLGHDNCQYLLHFIHHFSFIDGSPWQGFQVWCTHSCSLFLSLLFLLEILQNFIAKTDVQEQITPSILGAKCFN